MAGGGGLAHAAGEEVEVNAFVSVSVTQHARRRARSRLGLKASAVQAVAQRAYDEGVDLGGGRKLLHEQWFFLFDGTELVTCWVLNPGQAVEVEVKP